MQEKRRHLLDRPAPEEKTPPPTQRVRYGNLEHRGFQCLNLFFHEGTHPVLGQVHLGGIDA